jgi:hypothetical protein
MIQEKILYLHMPFRIWGLLFLCLITSTFAYAQGQRIENFMVKEHLLQNGQLAVIALDSTQRPAENLRGTFRFIINGFEKELRFSDGFGVLKEPIESSTFLLIQHKNSQGTQGKLYYIYKSKEKLKPYWIQWYWLLLIPLILALIAYVFKKLLWIIVLIFIGWMYFNYKNGLDVRTFFETLVNGIDNWLP